LDYTDEDGRLVWESLVGLEIAVPRVSLHAAADTRSVADAIWAAIRRQIATAPAALIPTTQRLATALEREEAIVRCAQQRHGRMASELRQRSLFDRRSDREVTAQEKLLARVCDRCRTRAAELWGRRALTAAGARPAFCLIQC
jgi:hypothetical protein